MVAEVIGIITTLVKVLIPEVVIDGVVPEAAFPIVEMAVFKVNYPRKIIDSL